MHIKLTTKAEVVSWCRSEESYEWNNVDWTQAWALSALAGGFFLLKNRKHQVSLQKNISNICRREWQENAHEKEKQSKT